LIPNEFYSNEILIILFAHIFNENLQSVTKCRNKFVERKNSIQFQFQKNL